MSPFISLHLTFRLSEWLIAVIHRKEKDEDGDSLSESKERTRSNISVSFFSYQTRTCRPNSSIPGPFVYLCRASSSSVSSQVPVNCPHCFTAIIERQRRDGEERQKVKWIFVWAINACAADETPSGSNNSLESADSVADDDAIIVLRLRCVLKHISSQKRSEKATGG